MSDFPHTWSHTFWPSQWWIGGMWRSHLVVCRRRSILMRERARGSVPWWKWSVTRWQWSVTRWQWSITRWQWSVTTRNRSATPRGWPRSFLGRPGVGCLAIWTFGEKKISYRETGYNGNSGALRGHWLKKQYIYCSLTNKKMTKYDTFET